MKIRSALCGTIWAAVLAGGVAQATPSLTLAPTAVISGAPGSTVGWGFSLTNDVGYLVPSFVNFCEGAYKSTPCTLQQGTFTDLLAQFQLVAVGPGAQLDETFSNATQQGIGSFLINAFATGGAQENGTIYLSYDRFSCDLLNDPACTNPIQITFSGLLSADAQVNVLGGSSPVPEPTTLASAGVGILVLLAASRRKG